jgi:integrase
MSGTVSAKTAERYRELTEHQIIPHLGAMPIQKLKPIDVETWRHTLLMSRGRRDGTGGLSNRTIAHAHVVLSKALREAARYDLVTKNVAAEQNPPKLVGREMVILSPEQLAALPSRLADHPIRPRVIVAVYCGLRRGEVLALRWSHVDLDAKVIRIREAIEETKRHGLRFKGTKTGAGRRDVSLPDIVVETLRAHRRAQLELRLAVGAGKMSDAALVFPAMLDDQTPMSPSNFSAEWRDVADRTGLTGVPLHALRHTHASQLIDAGVDIVTISKRLGHASPTITLRTYAHRFRKDDSRAAEAINAALAGKGLTIG